MITGNLDKETLKQLLQKHALENQEHNTTNKTNRLLGAMCYCQVPYYSVHETCSCCNKHIDLKLFNRRIDKASFNPYLEKIKSYGYDAKIEFICRECATKQSLFSTLNIQEDWWEENGFFIFGFKAKQDKDYFKVKVDSPNYLQPIIDYLSKDQSRVSMTKHSLDKVKTLTGLSIPDEFKRIPIHLPQSVVLELTYKCNHTCKFCSCPWYAPKSTYIQNEELTISQWKDVINRLYFNGVTRFSLTGGEFLLKDGWQEIIQHIRSVGTTYGYNNPIVVISNGKNMKTEYLQFFKEMNVHLSMSLPGYKTFALHTGVDNADGVLGWFEKAKQLGVKTTANITVTNLNYSELFETISLALLNGADDILLNRFLPGGRGLQHIEELKLSKEQVVGMLNEAEEILELSNKQGTVGTEIPKCIFSNAKENFPHISIGYQCAAAKGFFVIDPSGQVRVCNHSPQVIGNVFSDNFIDDTTYWTRFAERDYMPQKCVRCNNKSECDCGCREVAHILDNDIAEADYSIIRDKRNYKRNNETC